MFSVVFSKCWLFIASKHWWFTKRRKNGNYWTRQKLTGRLLLKAKFSALWSADSTDFSYVNSVQTLAFLRLKIPKTKSFGKNKREQNFLQISTKLHSFLVDDNLKNNQNVWELHFRTFFTSSSIFPVFQ